jgi:macrodomain Ter protein organizer (MatP/YcbG family)
MSKDKVVKKSISLHPMQWDYVTRLENQYQCSTSQAIRLLVESHRRNQQQLALPLAAAAVEVNQ